MAFMKTLLIAFVAALVPAAPGYGAEPAAAAEVAPAQAAPAPAAGNTEIDASSQSSAPVCGNGQKIACCNSGQDLIGANCLTVPGLAIPIQKACGSNVAACCQTGDASGNLINLELHCLAIPL